MIDPSTRLTDIDLSSVSAQKTTDLRWHSRQGSFIAVVMFLLLSNMQEKK